MIYNAVLNANRAVMNAAKPGNVLSFLILSAESESNQKYCDVTSVENIKGRKVINVLSAVGLYIL